MSYKLFSPLFAIATLFLSAVLTPAADAVPAATVSGGLGAERQLTKEQLEKGRKAAESDARLNDLQRQKALELYDQAADWLRQAEELKTRLARLDTLLHEAPKRIDAVRSGKVEPLPDADDINGLLAEASLERIELAQTHEQMALQQARDTRRRQADELSQLLVSGKGLNEEIASKIDALQRIDADLVVPAADEPEALQQARTMVLQARRMLRQSELDHLKLRLGSQDLLTNLAQAERDTAAAEIAQRERRVDMLNQALQQQRETQARQARQAAEAMQSRTESLPQSLQEVASESAGYRHELEDLVGREQAIDVELQSARRGLEDIKVDFERSRQRVEVVGATRAIGKMLQKRRENLPSVQKYRRNSAVRAAEIGRATDRQIEVDELLRDGADVQAEADSVLAALSPEAQGEYKEQARELTVARRDALNELQKVYGRYIGRITALDLAERQLVEVANAYIDYIDDQLIWIPGIALPDLLAPANLLPPLLRLLAPESWLAVAGDLLDLVAHRPLALLILVLAFLQLLRRHRWAERQLGEIAKQTRKIRNDSFYLTVRALLLSFMLIGAWPLLLIGAGGLLHQLPTATPLSLSLAVGLLQTGVVMFSLRFLIQICLPDGLGDRHLRWSKPVSEALVRELRWLLQPALPLVFLAAAGNGQDAPVALQSLGQIAFMALMLISSVFVYRLLRRSGPFMAGAGDSGPLVQLHFLWFPLATVMPVAFAVTSALGYQQAALDLQWHAELTFWLFVGLFLVKELLLRSLFVAERRLRYEDALRRREELRAQRAQTPEEKEDEALLIPLEVPEVNFDELSEQNKRLLQAGFLFGAVAGIWSIWSDLLPALGFLYSTELPLHAARLVDGVTQEVPITLGDLTVGIIMVLVTVLAAKNIPGVLEIAVLQRLPLDPGARYAITALTQYVIAGIGVLLAFSTLGLQWSNVQWLVAALSVGLGFGLQEIVANFISGIILLFERPIRVGDVVTLDNTTGVVSRIRIRATTITNWDKQELLIPNKEFITGRVINWTLSDKLNRVVITVGVAYGVDVSRAMALMLEAAQENPNVLEDPKPVSSFEAFGDNALTLLLRTYLGNLDNRLATITALHQAINDKFNAAGISIAFPQRDIHLSTERPLEVRLHRD
jgi:potassium efflux system protein